MTEIERRTGHAGELRIASEGPPRLAGYAALFDTLSQDLGGFRERIQRGAFAESTDDGDVRALFNHDPNLILGRTRSGTLRLAEDDRGLKIEIDPPDTQLSRDLLVSIGRGDVSQMSFGFVVNPSGQVWEKGADGYALRTLTSVRLVDVACVTFPAYTDTRVAVRSLGSWRGNDERPEPVSVVRRRLDLALI
jgi:uncharacterized protein